jgi:DNA-cytosine methyltransferase
MALAGLSVGGRAPESIFASDTRRSAQRWLHEHTTPRVLFADMLGRKHFTDGISGPTALGEDMRLYKAECDLDFYVVGFPCTPFSVRGAKKGFEDEVAQTFWSTVRTVSTMRPRGVLLENVQGLARTKCLGTVLKALRLVKGYIVQAVTVNAKDFGVPQNRNRIYIMMLRMDALLEPHGEAFTEILALVAESRCTPPKSFRSWLQKRGLPLEPSMLLEPQKPLEPLGPSKPLCTCRLGGGCGVHRCCCRLCGGVADVSARHCAWRKSIRHYMAMPRVRKQRSAYVKLWRKVRKNPNLKAPPGYFELARTNKLDLSGVLTTQRERNTVDAISMTKNILSYDVVFDVGQNIDRVAFRNDGLVPTLTCGCSKLFVPSAGKYLQSAHCLTLQGFDVSKCNLHSFSDEELFSLSGNAMTVSVVGTMLWAMLTQLRP